MQLNRWQPTAWWLEPLTSLLGTDPREKLVVPGRKLATWERLLAAVPSAQRTRVARPRYPECCESGLGLRTGHLDAAHEWVQHASDPSGMAWHCLMHRLEGDLGNAKYWSRRVGRHPIHECLAEAIQHATELPTEFKGLLIDSRGRWLAEPWIDLWGDRRLRSEPGWSEAAEAIAILEWELLFAHSLGAEN
ncbi:MAG: hypothetical protein R3B96_23390 [Pirellulaceae bacterium]